MFKTIPIKPEHHDAVKALLDAKEDAAIAFKLSTFLYKQATQELWKSIEEDYPEIKGYRATLDKKEMKIIILGADDA